MAHGSLRLNSLTSFVSYKDREERPMQSNTQPRPKILTETQGISRDTGSLMSKKIWLPKALYDLLPYFYLVSGIAAFFATLYINDWFWVLPHYVLFSAACLHLGIVVYRRRHRKKADA
jgi:Flp pilus assembly protein TadB